MFTFKPAAKTKLDVAIDLAHAELAGYEPTEKEYATCIDQMSRLYELKKKETPERVSKDTLAMVAANLLGIVLILHHEQVNVVTTKALSFVVKPK